MSLHSEDVTVRDLLMQYVSVRGELRQRGVIRTSNLIGDYAEWLVANRLGFHLERNSNPGYDAIDGNGIKYQVKSRHITPENRPKQIGNIRDLSKHGFDFLIAVIFNEDFTVRRVLKISYAAVVRHAHFRPRTNSYRFSVGHNLLNDPEVEDITSRFLY
jgi:Family of unknown function (DUF6998)